MGEEQRTAFLNSQVVAAQIEMAAMQAENETRQMLGHSPSYDEKAFMDLIAKYGIGHNQALLTLRGELA